MNPRIASQKWLGDHDDEPRSALVASAVSYNPPGAAGGLTAGGNFTHAPVVQNTPGGGMTQTGSVLIPRDKVYRPAKLFRLVGPLIMFIADLTVAQPPANTGSPNTDQAVQNITTYFKRLFLWQALGFAAQDALDGFDI